MSKLGGLGSSGRLPRGCKGLTVDRLLLTGRGLFRGVPCRD